METWRVLWAASELGYRIHVMNRIRIAGTFRDGNLLGDPLDVMRERAHGKAVEIALERRVPLDCVREDSEPMH